MLLREAALERLDLELLLAPEERDLVRVVEAQLLDVLQDFVFVLFETSARGIELAAEPVALGDNGSEVRCA